jgi:O-antigen ligase
VYLNKHIHNYFLILFSLVPITIIVGSAISVINILLIDFSFIILLIYKKDYYFLKNKTIIYFFILYIYLIFNSFISIDYSEGIFRNFGFLRIIVLFVAINYFFQDKIFSKKVFKIWSIFICIVLIDVLIESFTGTNTLGYGGDYELYGKRIVSFFKDEPIVGGYLNGFYLIIIGFLLNEFKDNKNYLTILLSIIFIISILLTGERSNTIRAFLGISIVFILYKNLDIKKKVLTLLTMMILMFILISNYNFLNVRFFGQIKASLNENNIYYKLYQSGFEVFKNNKLLGVGNKNYRVETCEGTNKNKKYFCTTHPHQIYFELLSEHGLIGTLIILSIFYKLIFSKILGTIREKNYVKIGSLVYLTFIFIPIIPSGAFFTNYALTIFAINLSIFYALDKKLNIFKKLN